MWRDEEQLSTRKPRDQGSNYLCWTRMQAEAGQPLERIIARKECERQAGEGLFLWGVGTAPAVVIRAIARLGFAVPVIFSTMRTKPRAADAMPARIVVWRQYLDKDGAMRPLPDHCLVTSRADGATGPKRAHYALMCRADDPLQLRSGTGFDHRAYRNASGKGAPVGASQVTALLEPSGESTADALYEVNMMARLAASYWVRLTDPREISARERMAIDEAPTDAPETWCRFVRELRRDPGRSSGSLAGEHMFV